MVIQQSGLSDTVEFQLKEVFSRFPAVNKVLLFGSRASNNFKPYSDIDLAVCGSRLSEEDFTHLWNELDALPLAFKLDVLHLDTLTNTSLKQKILAEGTLFYQHSSQTTSADTVIPKCFQR
ncbi:nucleotidyltransferase domain-containing protein [Lacimicrobium alkaliphilum]|uniref:Polymerase beta nucleotidyltransferase domain-containing protein n=1 Tax=Lacimicrobium alkaliphilum TaxID=1526571 RepID=A0ABQ1R7T5_9ALTE|nr:nucleotidyltransferase domain-containing protein [Lacimicrobium alkaliphilum]GGD57790.1 hypothetical protein GCM10011357_11480 [Lacimicrobium alkaliphilum]